MEVKLPGGLSQDEWIECNARFQPLTGRIEQTLIESHNSQDRSAYVTTVLCNVLDSIGDLEADAEHVGRLCVADRQFLMLRLAAMLNGEQMWLKVECGYCESLFDVETQRCDLPVKLAGPGYPLVKLQLNGDQIEVRVPTGEDQERIGGLSDAEALSRLLERCVVSVNGEVPDADFIDKLSALEIDVIDEALDEVSPAVCSQLLVNCPECGRQQYADLDHYADPTLNENYFYDEIHTLASRYHWSEADILDLPQQKRRRYLDLISRSDGLRI